MEHINWGSVNGNKKKTSLREVNNRFYEKKK